MKPLFSSLANKSNFLSKAKKNVYDAVLDFIRENDVPPNDVRITVTCTEYQFRKNIMKVLWDSFQALIEISAKKYDFPTTMVDLKVIPDPLPDMGDDKEKITVECSWLEKPAIIRDTEMTTTNSHFEDTGNYFDNKRLHFIVREYDPNTHAARVRLQFKGRVKDDNNETFKVTITNADKTFEETHSNEYNLFGNDEGFIICGSSNAENIRRDGHILHVCSVSNPDPLLEVRYNHKIGYWEYKIYCVNTCIDGENQYPSNNYMPMDDSLTITVEGLGLFLEPIGKPKVRR